MASLSHLLKDIRACQACTDLPLGPRPVLRAKASAMAALAREYDRTANWVKRHMGDVNDLHTIRQNLSDRKQQEDAQ